VTKLLVVMTMALATTVACSGGGSSGSVESFCSQAANDESAFSTLGTNSSDSQQGLKLFEDLTNKAPSDIKGDMVTILNALRTPTPSSEDSSQAASLTTASQRVVQFFKDKCHIDLGASSSSKFDSVASSIN
jgi:hypothetical protein